MKQWNLGNTTVRNPDRIRGGLKILSQYFQGKTFDKKTQEAFYLKLKENGLIESNPDKEGSKTHTARKWAAAFNQLGFARCWQRYPPIEITAPGKALLDENILDDDVFLRQLLKLQLPSPLERGSDDFAVHPLFVVIKITTELQKRGYAGLNRDEIALYVQTTIRDDSIEEVVRKIILYKEKKSSLVGLVKKRRFFRKELVNTIKELYQEEYDYRITLLQEIIAEYSNNRDYLDTDDIDSKLIEITATGKGPNVAKAVRARMAIKNSLKEGLETPLLEGIIEEHFFGTKADTLIDYSDTTIRYPMATGLFTINGTSLAIKQDRIHFVDEIISDGNPAIFNNGEYLSYFYNPDLPEIPTDKQEFLKTDIKLLKESARSVGVSEDVLSKIKDDGQISELKSNRKLLEDEILDKKEIQFYINQKNQQYVDEIKEVFTKIINKEIIGGSDYYPAWAEWAVWRVFLSIDTIANKISSTRHFKIDSDLFPIHHAKAGVTDMVFHYDEGCIIPTEVTLNTGERQYAAEREPVQTHVLYVSDEHPDKEVIGVFIAPEINTRTAHAFFKLEEWSNKRGCTVDLNIIPLTVKQLISLLPNESNGCTSSAELIAVLHKLLDLKRNCHNGQEWLKMISTSL